MCDLIIVIPTIILIETSAECPEDFIQNEEDCPEYERYGDWECDCDI